MTKNLKDVLFGREVAEGCERRRERRALNETSEDVCGGQTGAIYYFNASH